MTSSFAESLARSREGDRAALEGLFARWRPLLRLQASRALGADLTARVDPSDVVQETCTQAFADLEAFRGTTEGEWLAWLRKMVIGHAAKARRFHHAQGRDPRCEQAGVETAHPSALPLARLLDDERAALVAAAVEELPVDMRQVVVRRVFQRQPFAEVAQALGCTVGAARARWTRALRRLRQTLATVLGEPRP